MKKLFVFIGVFLFTVLCVRASVAQRSFQIDVAPTPEQLSNSGLLIHEDQDLLLLLIESFQQLHSVSNLPLNLRPYEHNGFPLPAINTDMDPGIILFFNNRYLGNKDPQILFHFDDEENSPKSHMPTFGTFDPNSMWQYRCQTPFFLPGVDPLLKKLELQSNEKLNIPDIDYFINKKKCLTYSMHSHPSYLRKKHLSKSSMHCICINWHYGLRIGRKNRARNQE